MTRISHLKLLIIPTILFISLTIINLGIFVVFIFIVISSSVLIAIAEFKNHFTEQFVSDKGFNYVFSGYFECLKKYVKCLKRPVL